MAPIRRGRLLATLVTTLTLSLGCSWASATPPPGQTESIPNNPYKLQMLHHQRESYPGAMDVIKARGFIGELYTILSRDGEPLSLYHIINPLADQAKLNKYPVLMLHGISGDAAQMISHSQLVTARKPVPGQVTVDPTDISMAFMLANNNFDVYLADSRGTNLNNHLVSSDLNFFEGNKYWNFSLDDQINNDLPAMLDFVLEQTHEDKLHYIGYSQSTLFIFAFLTQYPEYQEKIASVIAMAPVAFINNIKGTALTYFVPFTLIPDGVNGNYMPQLLTDTVNVSLRKLCQLDLVAKTMCQFYNDALSGVGDNESSHGFFASTLKSTSIKSVKQLLQMYAQRRFGMYDFGPEGNMRKYGSTKPPDYDLSKFKLPTLIIFRGTNDFLSDPLDQELLLSKLGTKPYLDFNIPNFNHVDFIMSRDIVKIINLPAVQAMFELLYVHTSRQNSPTGIFREPHKLLLPKMKPNQIVTPDGNRELRLTSNLVNNLINGVVEVAAHKIIPTDGGRASDLTGVPVTMTHFHGPETLFKDMAVSLNGMGSSLTSKLLPNLKY